MSSRRSLLLGVMLSVLASAVPLAAQQQVQRFSAFNCPGRTPFPGWKTLEIVPGLTAWIPVEGNREQSERLFRLPERDLRGDRIRLQQRIERATNNRKWTTDKAAADALVALKGELVNSFTILRTHGWERGEDIDELLSIIAAPPTALACIDVNFARQRSAPTLIQEAFRAAESKGCESGAIKPVTAGGVVLGLLKAQPLKDEVEVETGEHISLVREFSPVPLPQQTAGENGESYELAVWLPQINDLPSDFLSITPTPKAENTWQEVIHNGQGVGQRWTLDLVPGKKFKATTVTVEAALRKVEYDKQGHRQVVSPETHIEVPVNLFSLKPKVGPTLEDRLIHLKGVFEALFGKVGIIPVLYLLYRFLRKTIPKIIAWLRGTRGGPTGPTQSATSVKPAETGATS